MPMNPKIGCAIGKSDKILETVLRMDALLNSIHENLVSLNQIACYRDILIHVSEALTVQSLTGLTRLAD
jgi:hypothetical protein